MKIAAAAELLQTAATQDFSYLLQRAYTADATRSQRTDRNDWFLKSNK